jgi:hypothetical protein
MHLRPHLTVPIRQGEASPSPSTLAQDLAHVEHLFEEIGLRFVARRMPPVVLWTAYVFVNGFLSTAMLTLLAVGTGVPFVFPSLGPTAYQLFFSPHAKASTPHNTLIGHSIGLVCGYAAFHLSGAPLSGILAHRNLDWRLVIGAALSVAATAALMILFDASHPPAGATTLIVSLGIITRPVYLVMIEGAVLLLTVQAFAVHRLAGLAYPIWKVRRPR